MTFESVEKPVGTLDLLLYLSRRGGASVTEAIADLAFSPATFYAAKHRLKTLGLVYEEEQTGRPRFVHLRLTDDGVEAARTLAPFAERISSTLRALEEELARLEAEGDPATVPRRLEILDLLVEREFERGRWLEAERTARRLLELASEHGEPGRGAQGHLALGRILQKRDRRDASESELAEALGIADASGPASVACEADYLLGAGLERQTLYERAMERFASAAGRAERAGDAAWAARAKEGRARILARQGKAEDSLAILREVVAAYEREGARDDLARACATWGAPRTPSTCRRRWNGSRRRSTPLAGRGTPGSRRMA